MTAEPSALAPAQPREGLVRNLVPPRLFARAPLLPIGLAGAAACGLTMLVAATLPAGEARWGGQLQMTMASVVAASIAWRATRLAMSPRQRAFRFHLFLSSVIWLAVQLASLAGTVRPDVLLQPLEYALLLGWFVVVARCWHLALRERLGRVEVAAVYLDSTAVFITIAAGVLLMLGPVAAVNPGAARLL
ncbi:MAG TPA: hypothetical protein VF013_00480, partial [Candidatus Limnocylindria bacterium]